MIAGTVAKSVLSRVICLHPFYIARPHLWSPHLWEIDARIAVSLQRKFCYVRIPKAANTAVISTLFYHDTGKVRGRGLEDKRWFRRPSALLRLTPAALQEFFCFTFVRNPYHRALSAYLSKVVSGADRMPYRPIAARIRRRYGGGGLSFRAFCVYLDEEGPHANPHWYPQWRFVDALGAERLDFVGRVEHLNEGIEQVVRAIFGRQDDRTYRTSPVTGAADRLGEHYDATARDIVRRLYREDFERFGYDPAVLA